VTNLLKARIAGLVCTLGGLLFLFYFTGLNAAIAALTQPLETAWVPTLKMLLTCVAAVCLAGGPLGLLALGAAGDGGPRILGQAGAGIALLGQLSYIAGSLFIYNFPERAFRQLFTPGGSALMTLGMLLLGAAVPRAGRWRGWRVAVPLVTGLYFPLQFPLQATLFLGRGRGPNPTLLGAWGLFWLLQGVAISSAACPFKASAGYRTGEQPETAPNI
jgi:hypothetical protein